MDCPNYIKDKYDLHYFEQFPDPIQASTQYVADLMTYQPQQWVIDYMERRRLEMWQTILKRNQISPQDPIQEQTARDHITRLTNIIHAKHLLQCNRPQCQVDLTE
jgi:hypothetical protein